jgi:putative MATE family efflux protein
MEQSKVDGNQKKTEGVKILLGDPKKAIIKFSIPMIIGAFIQTVYNLIDAVWVAGKGANALSAIGFFFPILMFILAIANGVGVGTASAISQRIGAKDDETANLIAEHSIIIALTIAVIMTIFSLVFIKPIFILLGAGDSLTESIRYGRVMFLSIVFIMFSTATNYILRGEGEAKRVMNIMVLGPIVNIIIAPVFIYRMSVFNITLGMDLGVEGAGIATLISIFINCCLLFYWLFIKKDTYIRINLKKFKYNKLIIKNIFKVGLPAMLSQMSISIMLATLTLFVSKIGGDHSVATFTSTWRIAFVAIIPILGMSTAVVSIFGAGFGANEMDKVNTAYMYSMKIALISECVIAILIFILAPYITNIFTWSKETVNLNNQITEFLRGICLFFPAATAGYLTASLFQGTGQGFKSLIITFLRSIVFVIPLSYTFGILLNMGMNGINLGVIIGTIIASIIAFIWALRFMKKQSKVTKEVEC